MKKFITPVSMQVTEEQFKKDLEKQLEEFGYSFSTNIGSFDSYKLLVTNSLGNNSRINNIITSHKTSYSRHFINHYNPELFLALAAMTGEEYGIKGEWWSCKRKDLISFTKSKLYKQIEHFEHNRLKLKDDKKNNHKWDKLEKFKSSFRKATKEELITHFTKEKEVPMKKDFKVTTKQMQEIISFSCSDWRTKLASKYGVDMALNRDLTVPYELYEQGYKEADEMQRDRLDVIFPVEKKKFIPITFNSKEEFAIGIIKYGKIYEYEDINNNYFTFDLNEDLESPFRFKNNSINYNVTMEGVWTYYNKTLYYLED